MQDGTNQTISTNTNNQTSQKYVVARLDIYRAPGWFDVQEYDNEQDANIYCEMMNTDTNMIHRVFIKE